MQYFIADPHLGDYDKKSRVVGRPFGSQLEMTRHIIDRTNSKVPAKNSRLYIMGDYAETRLGFWRQQIMCKDVWLILGNHDASEDKLKRVFGQYKVKWLHETKINRVRCILFHYPIAYWNLSHRNSMHLYGHMHANREETLDAAFPDRRSLDVSVDNAKKLLGDYEPFSEEEVWNLIGEKAGHDPVEFYNKLRRRDGLSS